VAFYISTKNLLKNKESNAIHDSLKKYLGTHLTNDVKDLYNENCSALKKEIIGDTRRWKDLPCS
jgi:hypothetical protein